MVPKKKQVTEVNFLEWQMLLAKAKIHVEKFIAIRGVHLTPDDFFKAKHNVTREKKIAAV